jgi:putative restriction endonuclease
MLATFIDKFGTLRTDKSKSRWGEETFYRAPHKPLLLLAILDLFAEGNIQTNLIPLSEDLGELFSIYWSKITPQGRLYGNIAMPFFHLHNDEFWHLIPKPGKQLFLQTVPRIHSITILNETIFGASLDEQLFMLLQVEDARNLLRRVLIETYFVDELHERLLAQAVVNISSYRYSEKLLSDAKEQQIKESGIEWGITPDREVRDQGFRRAIVKTYNHRCALCGIRILTADGHTAIAAAHIIPWNTSHNDDPRNGLALCPLCHWTFDEGLVGITDHYLIRLSPQLPANENIPGHLLTVADRKLIGPSDETLWPYVDSIRWHRKEVFRSR